MFELVQQVAELLWSSWQSLWSWLVELLLKMWKLAQEGLM